MGQQGYTGGPRPGGMQQMHPPAFGGPMGGGGGMPPGSFTTPARPTGPPNDDFGDDFGDFGSAPTPMPRAPPPTPAGPVPHGVSKDHALDDDLFAVS